MGRLKGGVGVEVSSWFKLKFDIDMVKEYERLEHLAEIPMDKLRNREEIMIQMNTAAKEAHRAHILYAKAKRICDEYERDVVRRLAGPRKTAVRRVEQWLHLHQIRGKSITEKMVNDELLSDPKLSESYMKAVRRLDDVREIRDNFKSLANQWNNRVSLLQSHSRLISESGE
jgi:hypothetical protein